ncbi:MAG: hypothetical protein ACUZ8E_07015 [Candidatus Anammoxibacter sp.]
MKTAQGQSVNGEDDHWMVNCPDCDCEIEYTGVFDSKVINTCKCGCKFVTDALWIDDEYYIN